MTNKYSLGKMLKKNEYGSDYEVRLKGGCTEGQVLLCKSMKKVELQDRYSLLNLKSEKYIIDNTDHPNIVRVFDIFEDSKNFCVI